MMGSGRKLRLMRCLCLYVCRHMVSVMQCQVSRWHNKSLTGHTFDTVWQVQCTSPKEIIDNTSVYRLGLRLSRAHLSQACLRLRQTCLTSAFQANWPFSILITKIIIMPTQCTDTYTHTETWHWHRHRATADQCHCQRPSLAWHRERQVRDRRADCGEWSARGSRSPDHKES